MPQPRITANEIIEKIEHIRRINREVGFTTLIARENLVQQEMSFLAEALGAEGWQIRSAVLSARGAHEVGAELEALACVH